MTYLGTGTKPLRLCYDSSDRNTCLVNYDSNGNGAAMYYARDVQGRLIYREADNIANWNWNLSSNYWYGYTGSGDTPDFVRDANWNVIEKTLQLPGGVTVTIKPTQTGANNAQYSLPNIHGDTLLTTDATGTNTSNGNGPASSFTYDPFGNILTGSTLPNNADYGSFGYVGGSEKFTESTLALAPIQMGARVYLPTLGRFTSVDPIQGGTPNVYVYPTDPVNDFNLSGTIGWKKWFTSRYRNVASGIKRVQSFSDKHPTITNMALMLITRGRGKGSEEGVLSRLGQRMALKEISSNPYMGKRIIPASKIGDPKYNGEWEKWTYNLT